MKKFLVVGTQRTGSSAIAEAIGLHPEIACGWEWTLHTPLRNKVSVGRHALAGDFSELRQAEREHIQSLLNPSRRWLGYRCLFRSSDKWLVSPVLSPAIHLDGLFPHLRWLRSEPDIHVVHIVRRDNVAWLRSKYLSKETNAYSGKQYPQDMSVEIPMREAIRRIVAKNWLDACLADVRGHSPYLKVVYEDFVADEKREVDRVYDFLSCGPFAITDVERRLSPQSSTRPSAQISNFDELSTCLAERGLLLSA